jgi:hypothetical protein
MQICATNRDNESAVHHSSAFAQLNSRDNTPKFLCQTGGPRVSARSAPTMLTMSTEAFVWFELSLVPEVEHIFIEREEDGKEFRVITVVNERDPQVRGKIYEREKAVIDAYPHLNFDFHISARMNRQLSDLAYGIGKTRFER